MADRVSKKKRAEMMSKVKSKDSKIEIKLRKALWREGFRYSKNSTKYFGKPDIAMVGRKTVIFVDSCFWHGCKKHGTIPKTRRSFWLGKIERNCERDKEVGRYYKKLGWRIFRVWEHDIKSKYSKIVGDLVKKLKK